MPSFGFSFGAVVRRAIAGTCLILSIGVATPAVAQSAAATPAPVRQSIDPNGVDLFRGAMTATGPTLSMGGDSPQGLAFRWANSGGASWHNNIIATLRFDSGTVLVALGGKTDRFTASGTSYVSTEGNGSTLSYNGTTKVYTYRRNDGTVIYFDETIVGAYPFSTVEAVVTDITWPSGATLTFSFDALWYCVRSKPGGAGQICTQHQNAYRIGSAKNDAGYEITFHYLGIDPFDPNSAVDGPNLARWGTIHNVSMTNTKVAGSPTLYQNWSWAFDGISASLNITDAAGKVTKFGTVNGTVVGRITLPGSTSPDVTVAYSGGRVSSVTNAAGVTSYASSDASGVRTVTVTRGGEPTIYKFNIASERMTSVTDALGNTTSFSYDGSGRVTEVIYPEGNSVEYTYDARSNVIETRATSKTPGTPADIVTTASYPASCTNPLTCNKPTWTRDAEGNQTDYTYNSATGMVATMTAPAAVGTTPRPKMTYGYTNVGGVSLVNSISICITATSCAGTANEVKTTIAHNSNLLPTTITKASGTGSVSATTTIGYDAVGNRVTVDEPLSGTADTTTYRYDALRRLVGVISPDPDGSGSLKRRAQRTSYDDAGRVTKREVGTVTGISDAAWAAFVSKQQATSTYDSRGRKLSDKLTAGGTTYSVTQYSYDALGRLECTAQRMNSALWGSLPTSACTAQTAGSAGPDRITRAYYDEVGRIDKTVSGYGTSAASNDAVATFTDNGRLDTLVDGEGNLTHYFYDGFDRLVKTRYPLPAKGSGNSSTTDYERYVYDANGNLVTRLLRDGQKITYTYDDLNRLAARKVLGDQPPRDSWHHISSLKINGLIRTWHHRSPDGAILSS